MRGPGETQLESDRRQVRDKIATLKKRIVVVDRTRRLNSQEREAVPFPTIALVGYTNAGKSSLMNRLTGADVYVADQLFATLDSTVRKLVLPGRTEAMLVDTVGFVAKLPHELVAAFKGTLEQAVGADLILHLIDASYAQADVRIEVVNAILRELGADLNSSILVYNKSDLPSARPARPGAVAISARTGAGIETLLETVESKLSEHEERITVDIASDDGRTRAWLYQNTRVLEETEAESGLRVVASMTARAAGRLRRILDEAAATSETKD
jgi:GTP-binding protein HflX